MNQIMGNTVLRDVSVDFGLIISIEAQGIKHLRKGEMRQMIGDIFRAIAQTPKFDDCPHRCLCADDDWLTMQHVTVAGDIAGNNWRVHVLDYRPEMLAFYGDMTVPTMIGGGVGVLLGGGKVAVGGGGVAVDGGGVGVAVAVGGAGVLLAGGGGGVTVGGVVAVGGGVLRGGGGGGPTVGGVVALGGTVGLGVDVGGGGSNAHSSLMLALPPNSTY